MLIVKALLEGGSVMGTTAFLSHTSTVKCQQLPSIVIVCQQHNPNYILHIRNGISIPHQEIFKEAWGRVFEKWQYN